ncbi:MAG: 3'-5' exonuclease, partial [Bacteroidota bacterium]
MLDHIDATKVLFLDIETVSGVATYEDLDETFQALWQIKSRSVLKRWNGEDISPQEHAETYLDRAGIFAEFGKIVCISVGVVYRDKDSKQLSIRLKSYAGKDEKKLLEDFSELLKQYYNNPNVHFICGHNIKEFDVPYICRRMVVNRLSFPKLLDITGK